MTYRFPVALEPIYTGRGLVVPKVQAVVRQDTKEPLSPVSMKYRLIPHGDVVDKAKKFVSAFGAHEENFSMSGNGSRLVYQCTYKDRTFALKVGDRVGLRVYVENSYNRTKAVSVRIGFLVLSCLNGMVTSKEAYYYSCRHTGDDEIKFPDPASLMPVYEQQVARLDSLNEIRIPSVDFGSLVGDACDRGLLSEKGSQDVFSSLSQSAEISAWDLMQSFTRHTTHGTNMGEIGRLARLGNIDRWFNDMFYGDGYANLVEGRNDASSTN